MEMDIEDRLQYLIVPEFVLKDIPVDQAVAFLLGNADVGLIIGEIHGEQLVTLNTQFKTVAECLDLLAHMTDHFWKIWSNGMFYFLEQPKGS